MASEGTKNNGLAKRAANYALNKGMIKVLYIIAVLKTVMPTTAFFALFYQDSLSLIVMTG